MKKKLNPKTFFTCHPVTAQKVAEYLVFTPDEVEQKILKAKEGFSLAGDLSLEERARRMKKLLRLVRKNSSALIDALQSETGKTRIDSLNEVFITITHIKYLAYHLANDLSDEFRNNRPFGHKRALVMFRPHGVVGIISPWNYPLVLTAVPVSYALAAGNSVVLKPSEFAPAAAALFVKLAIQAGFCEESVQIVTGFAEAGNAVVSSANTDFIFFTGSTAVGKIIAENAAKQLKPVALELGGKDVMFVCDDANIKRAAHAAVWGAFSNGGQTCIASETILVDKSKYDDFLNEVKLVLKSVQEEGRFPCIGPFIHPKQKQRVDQLVKDAKAKGAKTLTYDFKFATGVEYPVILTHVPKNALIKKQEVFGPVMMIESFDTLDDAVAEVQKSDYALGVSVFTRKLNKAYLIIHNLKCGSAAVNDVAVQFGVPDLPFGGSLQSGIGRVHGGEGLYTFSISQSVLSTKKIFSYLPKEVWWYPISKNVQKFMEWVIKF